jgi:tetratricopeptide (TPR) repeat protein
MTLGFRGFSARFPFSRASCGLFIFSAGCVLAQGPLAWGAAPAFAQDTASATAPADRAAAYYHYGLAKIYEDEASQNGRQDLATQAIEQYKLALDADPGSRDLQDGLANLYFKLGRIREAVAAAQDQVTKHPDDVDAHILLGRVYLRSLGDGTGPQTTDMLSAGIKEYETIARLKPSDVETHLLLGQLYGLNHESLKAEEQFKIAQRLDPNSEEAVLSLARLYTEQGDLNRAAKVLADVSADDRSPRMNFALAGIYDQLKRPKEAVEAYRAVLAEDPDNADARRGLAEALMASGQDDAASKLLGEMTKTDPQDARALIHQADLERRSGKYEQALATLAKASALVQNDLELDYNKALTNDALGRFDESEKTLKDALAYSAATDGKYDERGRNNRALFLDRLAIVAREKGDTDDAITAYQDMAALGGDCSASVGGDCQAHAVEGEIDTYRDAHQWAKALETAENGAKQMPANHEIQLSYARQLADNGRTDEGLTVAKKQLTGKDSDREIYYTIADIDERANRWKDASLTLDKIDAISTKPAEKAFLYYYRGSAAERQKLFEEAEAQFKLGLAIEPKSASIENDYGYMLADRGIRLGEAIAMIKNAVDYDPQNAAYLDSLGWAYFKQGQYALAEDYERKAVARSGKDPAVLDHMGEIYARTGKLQLAVVEWQKSLAAYQTSLAPDADPVDVAKVQKKLEGARVRLAHAGAGGEGAVAR